ncbi:helix-turn-helix domain-containing protein [Sporolactobacillus nakayamae]|uniref:Transcriptional regulator, XRE family with cupin sensor n=1 Tax=Sporolactobacillus nakayamae TaxID=269670 RepID=A0A1I2PDP2_9BACL|nr:XRE family transcriptional regulator [Sporolactobacillus nakayamae]SFG14252.1 transcriptional regulator, XRE family with cupin sensor [Sporolactobacillus nakayamae]
MLIGRKIKNLRLKSGLTQEELAERTDLTKGYISQIERDLSSPSIETFFELLAVLGSDPKSFFDDQTFDQKVVYQEPDQSEFSDEQLGYQVHWLVPESNEKQMEPIRLTLGIRGAFKTFEPSPSETFVYVLSGAIAVRLGKKFYHASTGDAIYYHATEEHQLINKGDMPAEMILVATESYL